MNTINPKELQAWLDQEPLETDVFQKGSGVYIPVEIIKPRLDILDPSWSTKNYKHFVFVDHDGKLFCSGSVDLYVKYEIQVKMENGFNGTTAKIIERRRRVLLQQQKRLEGFLAAILTK
jgi:hypothetical protein